MTQTRSLNFSQVFAAGIIAGSLEVTLNHPLWVFKVRMQCGDKSIWNLKGIHRGWLTNIASMVPLIALRISFGTAFQNYFYGANPTSNQRVLSALIGGCIPSLIGSPIEFMRAQQQKTKSNFCAAIKTFKQQHGSIAFFRGMAGTLVRDGLYTCGFFALGPIFQEKIENYSHRPWLATAISGPVAGTIAAFTSQPFDAVKMYQQMSVQKLTMKNAAKKIIKKDSYIGFFKGATPRILRVISGVTIISNANEQITKYINKNR